MRYVSTRGQAPALGFEEVVLAGLASDGGLYVPESLPRFTPEEWHAMAGLTYQQLAVRLMTPFIGDAIPQADFARMVEEAYATFRHPDIAPMSELGADHWLLELFHGPTLAFKDFALQLLGRMLDYFLERRGSHAVIVGATSGDTGSAAIAGCRGRRRMDIYILHPEGRVSEVQRRQMTSVCDANVHNIAIDGTFDDCQAIVKALFADEAFRECHTLSAVNSINWARILGQTVYYAYAALKLGAPENEISFSVPTGNFGDIYAGYVAKQMGLPIKDLIIATNRNDILARCVETRRYDMQGVRPTYSPSMDIEVSSNFERLLFDAYGRDGATLAAGMEQLRREQSFTLTPEAHAYVKSHFKAQAVDDAQTLNIIRDQYAKTGQLLDPHSAVGVGAALAQGTGRVVTLATAHAAKFPDAVEKAVGIRAALPPHMEDLFAREERFTRLRSDVACVKEYIARKQHEKTA